MARWTYYQICLAVTMLITGSINTLSTKWADKSYAYGSDGTKKRIFDHPFVQAVGMFLGELACLAVFYIMRVSARRRGTPMEGTMKVMDSFIFLPAALCDMCATSLMYVGLTLTFASSFQMLRGSVIIFTALLSVAFLGRFIRCHMWLGMGVVFSGLVLVGVADIAFQNTENHSGMNAVISGDLLIIMAQIVTAIQMVYEEKYVTKHNVHPLLAVGLEGLFGFLVLGFLLIPMYFIPVGAPFSKSPSGRLEDVIDAFTQIGNNWQIILATVGNILSIAFFNFAGISVTKEISATTRMVIDSGRTLVIWCFALAVAWQPFKWQSFCVQLVGFLLLICGMCIYNDIICAPFLRRRHCLKQNTERPYVQDTRPGINADDVEPLLQPEGDNYADFS